MRFNQQEGVLVDFLVTTASGTAECAVVPSVMDELRERRFHPETVGLDRGYDTRDLVAKLRARDVTPHVAQNTAGRRSAIDGRTTRHAGYGISQRIRMRVEEIFGWLKTVGGFRKTRYRGLEKVGFAGYLVGAAYNLVRLARMMATPTAA
jgi:IS5 family transposase